MDVSDKEIWIFLSHSSADFDKVRLIRNYLEDAKELNRQIEGEMRK